MKLSDIIEYIKSIIARFISKKTTPVKRGPNKSRNTFDTGGMYYLGDLLKSLGDYNTVSRSLRKHHPDAYDYYARVGCTILNGDTLFDLSLNSHWRNNTNLPSIGMAHWRGSERPMADKVHMVFSFYQKIRALPGVQFTNSTMYEVLVYYREHLDKNIILGMPFYVSVDPDGELSILRVMTEKNTVIRSKKARSLKQRIEKAKHHSGSKITGMQHWGIPIFLKDIAVEQKSTPNKMAKFIFTAAVNAAETQGMGLLIRAKKNGVQSAFSIDLLRTPYFFKDRNKTVNEDGKTKKIFHIVRTHHRKLKMGTITVKTHFRGLRKFAWNGYDVTISMPGYHHSDPIQLTMEALHEDDPFIQGKKMLGMKEAGRIIDEHLNS